jgi:hypothetical protein
MTDLCEAEMLVAETTALEMAPPVIEARISEALIDKEMAQMVSDDD